MNKIIMSCSKVAPSSGSKSVSSGFKFVVYETLDQLAEAMHGAAHCSSVFSTMVRFDPYSGRFIRQERRRIHNISMIGNTLVYDFDSGFMSFKDAEKLNLGVPFLLIRSKSDPKYDHDRFKMIVVTSFIFPKYIKDDVPSGYEKIVFENYKDFYMGFAIKFGFWHACDQGVTDPSRLIASVIENTGERREYVVISQ